MEHQYKRTYKAYSAWNYEKEIEDLNKASKEGWQLVNGGSFSSRFKRNPDVCYRYQLDYRLNIEDMGRYIETFREQGWEYINTTFNGWSYFRKLYDPALPQEQYEIYTDRASMKEMNGRWVKLAAFLVIYTAVLMILQLINFVLMPKIPTLAGLTICGVTITVFIRAIWIMKEPERSKNNRWDGIILMLLFITLIVGGFSTIWLLVSRPHFNTVFAGEKIEPISPVLEDANKWSKLDIPYSDNYYMDLAITADAPICLSVVNEEKEVIYTATESSMDESNLKIYLEKGTYTIYLSDYAGGKTNITFEID